MPYSDLGLHCLPMSLLWDARHKWVNISLLWLLHIVFKKDNMIIEKTGKFKLLSFLQFSKTIVVFEFLKKKMHRPYYILIYIRVSFTKKVCVKMKNTKLLVVFSTIFSIADGYPAKFYEQWIVNLTFLR